MFYLILVLSSFGATLWSIPKQDDPKEIRINIYQNLKWQQFLRLP